MRYAQWIALSGRQVLPKFVLVAVRLLTPSRWGSAIRCVNISSPGRPSASCYCGSLPRFGTAWIMRQQHASAYTKQPIPNAKLNSLDMERRWLRLAESYRTPR